MSHTLPLRGVVADVGLTALLFGLALFGAAVFGLDLCCFGDCECSLAVASNSGGMSFPACDGHLLQDVLVNRTCTHHIYVACR